MLQLELKLQYQHDMFLCVCEWFFKQKKREMFVMSKKVLSLLFFILIFSFHKNIFSTVKGSESSVSVEPAYMFPAADADNKMLGFGWFKSGFSLEDNTTTCTFDSVYPVSGILTLMAERFVFPRI